MKKGIAIGVLLGLLLAFGVGVTVTAVSAQGTVPTPPTLAQMKVWHEAHHGAGTWNAMAQAMQQAWGTDWFNQMHGPNGFATQGGTRGGANGWNGNAPYGMMGGWRR